LGTPWNISYLNYCPFELHVRDIERERERSIVKKEYDKLFIKKGSISIFFSLPKSGVACILGIY
jgi:hypothetical protein